LQIRKRERHIVDNRRAYQRFQVQLDVKLRKLDGSTADFDAIINSVSFGGFGGSVSTELQPGTEISIEWPNPPFYFSGKAVAMCTVVGIGRENKEGGSFRLNAKFSDPDSDLTKSLLNWVQMQAYGKKRAQSAANRFSSKRKYIKF